MKLPNTDPMAAPLIAKLPWPLSNSRLPSRTAGKLLDSPGIPKTVAITLPLNYDTDASPR